MQAPSILYQDNAIIVINKPSGLPAHSRSGGISLEQYLPEFTFGYANLPMFAHRLDRDTSGCLILGRTKEAISRLGKMFMAKRISKTYYAIVQGHVLKQEGCIDMPLRKRSHLKNQWWMEEHKDGKAAITDYKVLGYGNGFSFLGLSPRTGRTHQLRVHCKAIGHPIIGDKIYGYTENTSETMHLHAQGLTIPFHHNQPAIEVSAPLPAHMLNFIRLRGV